MKEGKEAVGGAYSSEDDRDNITLSERRGSTLAVFLKKGGRVKLVET